MPAIGNVVINDGAATPVAHTFNPSNRNADGQQKWQDKVTGVAIGFSELGQQLQVPGNPVAGTESKASRIYRAKISLKLPTLEVTSPSTGTGIQPAPTLGYTCTANVEFLLPERSTSQNRKDLRVMLVNYLQHANAVAVVDNLEPIWG